MAARAPLPSAGAGTSAPEARSGGKVVYQATVSLDGYLAGPGDPREWAARYAERNPALEAETRATGAVLIGRNTFDAGRRRGPAADGPSHGPDGAGPRLVLTHRPLKGALDDGTRAVSGDLGEAVRLARAVAGEKNVTLLGAEVGSQGLRLGLVDEVLLHLVPVLLGGGVRLFSTDGPCELELERLSLSVAGPVTNLRFRVRRRSS